MSRHLALMSPQWAVGRWSCHPKCGGGRGDRSGLAANRLGWVVRQVGPKVDRVKGGGTLCHAKAVISG